MIWIALGGSVGALLRYFVGEFVHKQTGKKYYGTFVVNIVGSFILGFLFSLTVSDTLWKAIGIGVLGSFTTFSTFSVDIVQLFENKQANYTIVFGLLQTLASIVCCLVGIWVGKWL